MDIPERGWDAAVDGCRGSDEGRAQHGTGFGCPKSTPTQWQEDARVSVSAAAKDEHLTINHWSSRESTTGVAD